MDEKTTQSLEQAKALLEPWTEQATSPEEHRLDVTVTRANLKPAFCALVENHWGYLATITALDRAPAPPKPAKKGEEAVEEQPAEQPEGCIDVLYHMAEGAAICTLRVCAPYSDAVLPTVCDIYPAATLYEREAMELLGIVFQGTPSTERLVLPDEWPDGVYPLRKSFTGLESATEAAKGEAS